MPAVADDVLNRVETRKGVHVIYSGEGISWRTTANDMSNDRVFHSY